MEAIRLQDCAAARVRRVELDGETFWLKRPERRASLRWRLQKGDPRRAFEADLAGLRFMGAKGLPAPAVLLVGPDHFVTEDAGRPIDEVLRDDPEAEGVRAVVAATETLAALHRAGARHGRPKLRDICWDGQNARLIDFERFRTAAGARAMGLDWVIMLHSLLETRVGPRAAFDAAVQTYREKGPTAAVMAGAGLVRAVGWVTPGLRLALRLRPKNREIVGATRLAQAFENA